MNRWAVPEPFDFTVTVCVECGAKADEWTLVAERWTWWSDGCGGLILCPACAEREFGHRTSRGTTRWPE